MPDAQPAATGLNLSDLPRLSDEDREALDHCAVLEGVPLAPLRRCSDCRLDLGDPMLAIGECPLFGQRRLNVESRCASFIPKPNPPCRLLSR